MVHVDAARHRGLPCAAPSTCRALGRIGRRRRDVRVGRIADGRPGGRRRGGARAGRGRRSSRLRHPRAVRLRSVADSRNARAGRRPRRVSGRALGGGGADLLCAGPDVRRSGARPVGRALRSGPVGPWVYAYRGLLRGTAVGLAVLVFVLLDRPSGVDVLFVALGLVLALAVIENARGAHGRRQGRADGCRPASGGEGRADLPPGFLWLSAGTLGAGRGRGLPAAVLEVRLGDRHRHPGVLRHGAVGSRRQSGAGAHRHPVGVAVCEAVARSAAAAARRDADRAAPRDPARVGGVAGAGEPVHALRVRHVADPRAPGCGVRALRRRRGRALRSEAQARDGAGRDH